MKYGAIDKHGNMQLPFKYSQLKQDGENAFFAEAANHCWIAIDKNGNIHRHFSQGVEPNVRQGTLIYCTFHPDNSSPKGDDPAAYIDSKDQIYSFSKPQLPQPRHAIDMQKQFEDKWSMLRDRDGKLLLPRLIYAYPVSQDRLIVAIAPTKFSAEDWQHGDQLNGFSRYKTFNLFLEEYNLIGMPRAQVIALLGNEGHQENSNQYGLYGNSCANSWNCLFIEYECDRVKRWCFAPMVGDNPNLKRTWYTTDVIGVTSKARLGAETVYIQKNDRAAREILEQTN
jgi:hypothetical protein